MTSSLPIRLLSALSLAALAVTITSCASVPVPQDRLTSSESSLRAAHGLHALGGRQQDR